MAFIRTARPTRRTSSHARHRSTTRPLHRRFSLAIEAQVRNHLWGRGRRKPDRATHRDTQSDVLQSRPRRFLGSAAAALWCADLELAVPGEAGLVEFY